jgi:chromosome segregation ATPase
MEKRDAYVKKMQAKMDEWNAQIDKLAAKAQQAKADTKIAYEEDMEDLRAKRKNLQDKIEKMQKSSDDAWGDFKAGVEAAWESLDAGVKSAAERFK